MTLYSGMNLDLRSQCFFIDVNCNRFKGPICHYSYSVLDTYFMLLIDVIQGFFTVTLNMS